MEKKVSFAEAGVSDELKALRAEVVRLRKLLDDSEACVHSLVQGIPDPVCLKDEKGTYLQCNQAFARFVGVPGSEIIGKRDDDLFEKKRAVSFRAYDERAIQTNKPCSDKVWAIDTNNQDAFLEITRTPLRNARDELIGILVVGRDVTARNKFENESLFLSQLIELSELPAYAADMDDGWRMVFVNEATCKHYGLTKNELLNKRVPDWNPDFTTEKLDQLKTALKSGKQYFETLHQRSDGSMVPVEIHVSQVEIDGRNLAMGYIRDITERKQTERDVMILTSALNHSRDSVMLRDENFNFVYVNDAACRALGYTREELTRMTPLDFDADLDAGTLKEIDARHSAVGEHPCFERRHRARDGRIYPVEIAFTAIEFDGKRYGLSVCRDISERKQAQNEIEFQRQILLTQQETSPDAILVVDENRKILSYNKKFADLSSVPEEILKSGEAERLLNLIASRILDPEEHLTRVEWLYENRDVQSQEEIYFKNGNVVERYTAPILGENGRYFGRIWYFRDITERKNNERDLVILSTALNNMPDVVLLADENLNFVYANDAACQILGYNREEFARMTVFDIDPDCDEETLYVLSEFLKDDFPVIERRHRARDGRIYPVEISITWIEFNEKKYSLSITRDISDRKRHEAELQHLANHDVVTGLPNRRLLTDRLEQAVARAQRNAKLLAVCYLDLDNFKPINDMHGHAVGDQLLVLFTQSLKKVMRAEDTLARLGGDEFALLFTDVADVKEVYIILERLLEAISSPVKLEERTVSLSASIGVTLYPDDNVDADTLLRHADQAMYLAKEQGKNRYHLFDPAHERLVQQRRENIRMLRQAIENDELVLYYQPKIDLVSGAIVGAEALIRWQHPVRGLLSPGEFLHYLEGSDLTIDFGEWVIHSALKQIENWRNEAIFFPVSVNISAEHLLSDGFAERLGVMLKKHPSVSPSNLELEIVETVALSDMPQAVNTLTQCHEMGVKISLDDFGTGYSSLTYLRQLPVDILKIDQSFVRDMLLDPSDRGIVVSVIQLAQTFDRAVIAEGVETLEQGAMLIHLGCCMMQGYGIAHPMPAEEMPHWISQWRKDAIWKNLKT